MTHTREEVIERAEREFALLEELVAALSDEAWALPLKRSESKDPWTVKDALAHITYWKEGVGISARGERRPPDERGLAWNEINNLIYTRWRGRSPREVLAWHRQVHAEVLAALKSAPEAWYSGRKRGKDWPSDLDGHSSRHRTKDIEQAVKESKTK